MSENDADRTGVDDEGAGKSGWWWKFTALLMGVPPIAVYGAEDEVERERAADATD